MTRVRRGMIHGRFQPFHRGHFEYLQGAADASDEVFVGITNPDPTRVKPEPSDPLRHLPESNPYTYAERLLMVEAAAAEIDGIPEALDVLAYDPQTAGGLLAAVPAERAVTLEAEFTARRIFLRRIGVVEEGSGVVVQ